MRELLLYEQSYITQTCTLVYSHGCEERKVEANVFEGQVQDQEESGRASPKGAKGGEEEDWYSQEKNQ